MLIYFFRYRFSMYIYELEGRCFAFRNVRLVIHFFFHLMLGVTHLLLEKDFSSANLTELRNNRDTMQDFQGIFKIHVLMTIIHGDIKHIPTRVIRPAFWMLVSWSLPRSHAYFREKEKSSSLLFPFCVLFSFASFFFCIFFFYVFFLLAFLSYVTVSDR